MSEKFPLYYEIYTAFHRFENKNGIIYFGITESHKIS